MATYEKRTECLYISKYYIHLIMNILFVFVQIDGKP